MKKLKELNKIEKASVLKNLKRRRREKILSKTEKEKKLTTSKGNNARIHIQRAEIERKEKIVAGFHKTMGCSF